jgi:transcriptional regulator GlxA family with amidase domain
MLSERLLSAQISLSEPRKVRLTVTGVATEHGFYQLGRFAAIYRETFGEAPSDTLRAAGRAGGALPQKINGDGDACTTN